MSQEKQPIRMTRRYRTRDGRPVRILCIDAPNPDYPVWGFVEGSREAACWTALGTYFSDNEHNEVDLIEEVAVRRTHRLLVPKYGSFVGILPTVSAEEAMKKDSDMLAYVQIDVHDNDTVSVSATNRGDVL